MTGIIQDDSDSDSDLILPVRKRVQDQVKDLRKIIKLNSSARKRRENYNVLSSKISQGSFYNQGKVLKNLVERPGFVQDELLKEYFTTNVILAMINAGKMNIKSDNLKWLIQTLMNNSKREWKFLILQAIRGFLMRFPTEKAWEIVFGYLDLKSNTDQIKVVLEVCQILASQKSDITIFQKFIEISKIDSIFSQCFVELAGIIQKLLLELESVLEFLKNRKK